MAIKSYMDMVSSLAKMDEETTPITEKGESHSDTKFENTHRDPVMDKQKSELSDSLAMDARRKNYALQH